ncbi:hypothetical protein SUNI508_04821 [Seiridium unicorne]|uniref:Protein kinase domain-containing protein n=1 Tax=Seiridium unicorne TaxID=138068 RepID=A0ABR2V6D5_9PEZI
MATQAKPPAHEPPSDNYNRFSTLLKRFLGRNSIPTTSANSTEDPKASASETSPTRSILRRASRRVVPGLPRAKTFKRQQSEVREKLEVDKPTPAERRAVSVDRRGQHPLRSVSSNRSQHPPRASAPEFLDDTFSSTTAGNNLTVPHSPTEEKKFLNVTDVSTVDANPQAEEDAPSLTQFPSREPSVADAADAQSITSSTYSAQIHDELERKWILNLSMHFRDKSKREKFFVTYREKEFLWRRVTISLDYRDAPPDSLEGDLLDIKFQREKSAKIYEAIRESLQDIQFYETVTNLKLQTTEGRLHVHVVEDVNEIIHFPIVRMIQHLGCRRVRERDILFDSHMSGFVYKVQVEGRTLIKKEIPGPDTVDEFLYEVNALSSLRSSSSTIAFYGVVVDDEDQNVKGLLIDYAEKGALIDIVYDAQEHGLDLPWTTREKWARQIVQGLSDIHEAGFVQGDFTLSNIVIDEDDNAKIIDINRRGCPVGWEPPEATPLIESNQRISMYIGVKSDLYQLGMVLWALAMLEDEPEAHRRPLRLDPEIEVPKWYRRMVENCLHENPRVRLQATALLAMFPEPSYDDYDQQGPPSISVDDGRLVQQYLVEGYERTGRPVIRTVTPQSDTYFPSMGYQSGLTSPGLSEDAYYYPPRGRSPPSPLPSNLEDCDAGFLERNVTWSDHQTAPSISDLEAGESQAKTPKDTETAGVQEITKQLEGTLKTLEAQSQHRPVDWHNPAYEEDQSIDLEPPSESGITPRIVIEETKEDDGHDRETEAPSPKNLTLASKTSETRLSPAFELGHEDTVSQDAAEKALSTPALETKAEMDEALNSPVRSSPLLHQAHDPAEDDQISDFNYVHHGEAGDYTTALAKASRLGLPSTTNDGPAYDAATDLTGIGSGHSTQDDFRSLICSDDDLGVTTTASQNVSSQA